MEFIDHNLMWFIAGLALFVSLAIGCIIASIARMDIGHSKKFQITAIVSTFFAWLFLILTVISLTINIVQYLQP